MAQLWWCPKCDEAARTVDAQLPMHHCHGLAGLLVPLVRREHAAKVEVIERLDYVGDELVQMNGEDRPVMAVVTTRDDGQDCTVYAPTAVAGLED